MSSDAKSFLQIELANVEYQQSKFDNILQHYLINKIILFATIEARHLLISFWTNFPRLGLCSVNLTILEKMTKIHYESVCGNSDK